MRKLKLLAALLAMVTVMMASSVSPAMAEHWDEYDDPWGECGWMEVWDTSIFYPYYEFEGYEYDCHENFWEDSDNFRDGPPSFWNGPDNRWGDPDDWDDED